MMPRRRLGQVLTFAALCVVTAALALPFLWMAVTALKPMREVVLCPPTWWPSEFRWQNFVDAWQAAPFGRFYLNSLVVAGGATVLQVFFALLMAYAFAAVRFPGKQGLFLAILATMMAPEELKLVPNYLLTAGFGGIDTYAGLVLPGVAHAFPVFVLYQQFRSLPRDLFDAARADGAGHLRTLFQVAAPVSRPVVAAVVLIAFLGRWNDFLWPFVVTDSAAMRTLPVGLAYLKESQEGNVRWNLLMAGSIFVIIPTLAAYVAAQKQFVEGIIRGALKG